MATLNKYSNTITKTNINNIELFFYKDELKSFYNPLKNVYYVGAEDMGKRTLLDAIKDTHNYKYKNAQIHTCYNLNNLICNITYVEK